MPGFSLTTDLLFVLLIALIGGVAASYLRLPVIIGYLLAGIVFGPNLLGVVSNSEALTVLAEVGIALLMFTLGVELSLKKLYGIGKVAVVGGVIQILATILFSLLFTLLFGWEIKQSLFFGILLSLSSTAVVVKILNDKNLLDTIPGELSSGWLLVQDLAVLPIMLFLPILGGEKVSPLTFVERVFESALIIGVVIYLGVHFIPKVLVRVAKWGRELLFLLLVTLVLLTSFMSSYLGLSFSLGAFLAGLIITESKISEEALSQIKSLRNLFLVIFFVTVGMLFDPKFLIFNIVTVIIILLIHYFSKFVSTFSWIYSFGFHEKPSFLGAAYILQVGEFSFVLALLGLKNGLMDANSYNLFLSSALISLLLTPTLIDRSEALYKLFKLTAGRILPKSSHSNFFEEVNEEMKDHVVVCGYGRVGRYVSDALKHLNIPQVVIDYDPTNLKVAEERGIKTIYGDSAEIEILKTAQVPTAQALVISHPDQTSALLTIYRAKELNNNLKILARAHKDEDVDNLKAAGIHKVIQPEFEASLTFAQKLLEMVGVEQGKIDSFVTHIRRRTL